MRSQWSNQQNRHSPTLDALMGQRGDRQESAGSSCHAHKGNQAEQDDGEPSAGTLRHLTGQGESSPRSILEASWRKHKQKQVKRKEQKERGKRKREKERKVWETSVPGRVRRTAGGACGAEHMGLCFTSRDRDVACRLCSEQVSHGVFAKQKT